jgi:hypothetical protein
MTDIEKEREPTTNR